MKQVFKQSMNPTNVVYSDDTSCMRYYGILYNGSKGFITRPDYNKEREYYVLCAKALTQGNTLRFGCSTGQRFTTIQGLIEISLENEYKVYEFETFRELFTWLAE